MRTSLLFLALVSTASAATLDWTGYAGLADRDNDGYPAFVGAATATTSGWTGKVDCRDDIAGINPGAKEIVADGIDQNCSGDDLVYPVAAPAAARYIANSGAKGSLAFIAEYGRCSTATECDVDDVAGTMKINVVAAASHVFKDVYCGTSKTLGADGVREVVTIDEASHFRGTVCAGVGAKVSGTSTSGGGGSGISTKAATKIAATEAAKVVQPLREEMLAADVGIGERVTNEATARATADSDLNEKIDEVDEAAGENHERLVGKLGTETEARMDADSVLSGRVSTATNKASTAETKADAAASHGPLIEAGAVVSALFHRGINAVDENGVMTGDMVRGNGIGGGGFELRAGVDASGYQVAGFGQFSFGSDGQGTGPDTALLVGADALFDLGSVEFGPWLGYSRTEDHINLLDVSVVENGGLVGVTLQGDFVEDSALRVVPFARLGAGIGYYGNKGTIEEGTVVNSDYGYLALLETGLRFGAGALQQ